MQIFEYPYLIIVVFVLGFILLGSIGIVLAIKALKTANDHPENDFINIRRFESDYKKASKTGVSRSVIYINVSMDHLHSPYSEQEIFAEIENILLHTFSTEGKSICSYDSKNFVVLAKYNVTNICNVIESCKEEINKCLLEYGVLNTVEVRFGLYSSIGSHVAFDVAIGRAKQATILAKNEKNSFAQWNVSSGKALEKKIKIENNIEREIDNNRFFLEYQPVLDAKTKKIIGAEVLSRLNSESDGILTPGSFLSAVDSVGLNDKFDYYIFEKNCKWISNNKPQRESYKYTINFSRSTLCEPAFAEKIIGIAEKYDLKFSCIAVEILEDKNVDEASKAQMINNLTTLKQKGMSILLDDFGSGFTTFDDLQNLDISIVKIDKAITHNAVTETGFIILKNIIKTSKDIGFKTLCEGIETKEQEEAVIRAGCDLLQGFYYYRPMSVSMLENLFKDN